MGLVYAKKDADAKAEADAVTTAKLTTASTTSPQPYCETTQAEHSALRATHSDPGGV